MRQGDEPVSKDPKTTRDNPLETTPGLRQLAEILARLALEKLRERKMRERTESRSDAPRIVAANDAEGSASAAGEDERSE